MIDYSFSKIKTEICPQILHKYKIGDVTSPEDTEFLNEVFSLYHDEWLDKTQGESVVHYKVCLNYYNVNNSKSCTPGFWLVTKSGYSTDIGYSSLKKTPNPITKKLRDVKKACRTAIAPFINSLRNDLIKRMEQGEVVYSQYNPSVRLEADSFDVDHYEKTFDEITFEWIKIKGLNYLYNKVNVGEQQSGVCRFTVQSLIEEFCSYHNSGVTKLRFVTKHENNSVLRKGRESKNKEQIKWFQIHSN